MNNKTICLALLLGLALATLRAQAGDGYFEINQDCAAVGCFTGDAPGSPITIPVSGRYRLTSDISNGTTIQFSISASDVDLDLGGFSLDGGGRCVGVPVTSCSGGSPSTGISLPQRTSGYYLARIHDGTVRGFSLGILASTLGAGSSLERLLVTENSNNAAAILLDKGEPNSTVVVSQSQFVRNRSDGIRPATNPGDSLIRMVVRNSTFSGNGNLGLGVYGGSVLSGNVFADNANFGLSCSGNNGAPNGTAASENAFFGNKASVANSEYNCVVRDMGGNVCQDGGCP